MEKASFGTFVFLYKLLKEKKTLGLGKAKNITLLIKQNFIILLFV